MKKQNKHIKLIIIVLNIIFCTCTFYCFFSYNLHKPDSSLSKTEVENIINNKQNEVKNNSSATDKSISNSLPSEEEKNYIMDDIQIDNIQHESEDNSLEDIYTDDVYSDFFLSEQQIKNIVKNKQYEPEDKSLKTIAASLNTIERRNCILAEESSNDLESANSMAAKFFKLKLYELLNKSSYTNRPRYSTYVDCIESANYYKYTCKYSNNLSENDSLSYTYLIFKSNFVDYHYPYIKECDKQSVKKFGDTLSVLSASNRILIKSAVEEDSENFTYHLYYIIKYDPGFDYGFDEEDYDKENNDFSYVFYDLRDSTFSVEKSTGKINFKSFNYKNFSITSAKNINTYKEKNN